MNDQRSIQQVLLLGALLLLFFVTGCTSYSVMAYEAGTYPKVDAGKRVYLFAPSTDTTSAWQVYNGQLDDQGLEGSFRPLPADSARLLNKLPGKRIKRELDGTVLVHAARGWSFSVMQDDRKQLAAGQIRLVELVGKDKAAGDVGTTVLVGGGVGLVTIMVLMVFAIGSIFAAMMSGN